MITRLLTFAAYVFSFFTLVAAGGLPTSNSGGASSSSGSSSNSYSGGASTSISNPLHTLELKNGLNIVQSLVYGKKYEKAEIKLMSLEVKFPQNADIQNYLGFVSRKMNKLGKSDACKLKVPRGGIFQTTLGSIRKATTTNTSASNSLKLFKKTSSFKLEG